MQERLPISVCLIVRDEEKNLAGAINSVREFVREVVVVDTGSRDQTVEIARALGAKVLSFPWQDDFALARNAGLQAATQEWILSLDADQRLDPDSVPALAAVTHSPYLAHNVTIRLLKEEDARDSVGDFASIRLFRRDDRIRFSGRVHENVAPSLLQIGATQWPDSGVILRDFGYGDAQDRQKKRERNLLLLERARAENPDDLFVLYKYALTLPNTRAREGADVLAEAVTKAKQLNASALQALSFVPQLVSAAIEARTAQGRLVEAAEMPQFLLPVFGGNAFFIAGRAAAKAGNVSMATGLLEQFLTLAAAQQKTAAWLEVTTSEAEACMWLGWLARLSGDLEKARTWLSRGLSVARPDQRMPLECEAIRVLLASGAVADASEKLGELYALAQRSDAALAELMLVSAEMAQAVGDREGATEMARAAIRPTDDRACALLATLELAANATVSAERLAQLMETVPGLRFDTLAIRALLAHHLGVDLGFELPQATKLLLGEAT